MLDPRELARDAEAPTREPDPEKAGEAMKMAAEMADLKDQIDALNKELKGLTGLYDEIRKEQLPRIMHEAGMVNASGKGSFTLQDGRKIYLQGDMHVNVKKADEPAFFAWLRKNGLGDLIKETVHYQTLRAFCKERMTDGEELPEVVESSPYLKAVIRKA